MGRGLSRGRVALLVCLAVVLVIVGIVGVRTWLSVRSVAAGGGIIEPIDGRYTIALLGSDSADWRDGARVDSATLASVDAVTGRTVLISVPRNLVRVPFLESSPLHALYPDGYVCPNQKTAPCMLTMVYQLGLDHADLYPDATDPGAEATVDALEGVTGVAINYYALIDLDGFESLIDAVGGVDMDMKTRVPIGAVGTTMYWIEPGEHHFTGPDALWYVRSRVGTDDYARMARQKCVMLALAENLDPMTVATSFLSLADAAAKTAHTNIPASQMSNLAGLAEKAITWTVTGLSLTPPVVDPLNPDYSAIRRLVVTAIAQSESLDDPSATPSDIIATDLTTACGY